MNLNISKKRFNRREDLKFMTDRKHQNAARHLLLQIAREKVWSKEGFLNECTKRGFLKTPVDKVIVKDVLNLMKFGAKGDFKERRRPDVGKFIKKGFDDDNFDLSTSKRLMPNP